MDVSPRLIADYSLASTSIASPARLRIRRASASPNSLTAGLTTALITTVEKALSAMGRCTSPPLHDAILCERFALTELPKALAELVLGHLSADDLAACAFCCKFLHECTPAAAMRSAQRIGFELQPPEPQLSASGGASSSTHSITRRLHTLECQAWLAARTMEKLDSEDRATREVAVLRCSSLPLAAISHHDLALVRLTECDHVEVRLRALRTLSQFSPKHTERLLERQPAAVDAVLARFEDADDHIRRAAVAVLQAWIAPDAVLTPRVAHALRYRCDDTHELVASAAYRLLEAHEHEVEDEMDDETDGCEFEAAAEALAVC